MKRINTLTKIKSAFAGALLVWSLPLVTLAQLTEGNSGDLGTYGKAIVDFINGTLVPFVFAVALLLFIYGMFLYFFAGGGEEDKRKEGRYYMLWAILAFVVMVSVWGIVNLIAGGLGFSNEGDIDTIIPKAAETKSD